MKVTISVSDKSKTPLIKIYGSVYEKESFYKQKTQMKPNGDMLSNFTGGTKKTVRFSEDEPIYYKGGLSYKKKSEEI